MAGARVIGVVLGTADAPEVAYLDEAIPVDELTVDIDPAMFGSVFRIAAECEGSACVHFENEVCSLGERIARDVPGTVDLLPRCAIRRDCRWYAERGPAACRRCPQILTRDTARPGNAAVAAAAVPPPG